MQIAASQHANGRYRCCHVGELASEAHSGQVRLDLVDFQLGHQPDDAAVHGDEVPFVSEPPDTPLQVCSRGDADRERLSTEDDRSRESRALVVFGHDVTDAELVLLGRLDHATELVEALVLDGELADEVDLALT